MTTYIGLLRAVNVAGRGLVRMEALRDQMVRMGLDDVRTVLQSGNVVFRSEERSTGQLERRLDIEVASALGLPTDVFVRSAAEWQALVRQNPYPAAAKGDPGHLTLTVLKAAPSRGAWRALQAAIPGREQLRGIGREAYIVYPDGIGRSRLTSALIERTLGTRGTSRNWNTVGRLAAASLS